MPHSSKPANKVTFDLSPRKQLAAKAARTVDPATGGVAKPNRSRRHRAARAIAERLSNELLDEMKRQLRTQARENGMDAEELVRREREFEEEYAKRLAATHADIDALHAPPPSEPVKSDSVVNTVTQDGYTVSTELEYATLPTNESKLMNLLVTATPPPTDAVELDVALALDQSGSMGDKTIAHSPSALLVAALTKLFAKGVPGVKMNANVFGFGTSIKSHGPEPDGFTELCEESRHRFTRALDGIDGVDGGTDISEAVAHAAKLFSASPNKTRTAVKHLVVLTDGHANRGMECADRILAGFRAALGETTAFVHVITLGGSVDATFARTLVDNGRAGIIEVAPDAAKLDVAFEALLSTLARAKATLDVKVDDASAEVAMHKRGMLLEKRGVLVDFVPRAVTNAGAHPAVCGSIELVVGGGVAPIKVDVLARYDVGATAPAQPSAAVAELLKEAKEAADLAAALAKATSLEDFQDRAMQFSSSHFSPGIQQASMRMSKKARKSSKDPAWRSLGKGQASALLAAQETSVLSPSCYK